MADPLDLRLPPVFKRTLDYLRALDDAQFEAFEAVLAATPPAIPTEEAAEQFAQVLPPAPGGSITGLLEFALSTRRLTGTLDADVTTIAEAITRAYPGGTGETEHPDDALKERVRSILSSDFIALREKSLGLAAEAELHLRGSRCITDLRPIFAADGNTEDLAGFLVVHTLKLDVAGGGDRPVFVSMDHDGVEKLLAVLQRALEKEARLARLLDESKILDLSIRA